MYKYSVDDTTTKKVVALAKKNTNEDKINKLIESINGYNDLYDFSTSVEYNPAQFEKMENVKIDEENIKSQAETELADYRNKSIQNIESETELNKSKLEKDKERSQENYQKAKEEVKDYYNAVKQEASDDALRRGLSRSSIVINQMDAFDKSELSKYNELNHELTETINNIDSEISALTSRQEQALQNFEIEYAVKLQDRITDLTDKLLERQTEVLKYNNEIAEKEADYNTKYTEMVNKLENEKWNREQDMMDFAGKYGANMLAKYKNTQIYNTAVQYLDSVNKTYAVSELTNNETLRQLLGEENVAKLLEKYKD